MEDIDIDYEGSTERLILSSLVRNEEFARKALPNLKEEYFFDAREKDVYNKIKKHFEEYTVAPTRNVLKIEIRNDVNLGTDKTEVEIAIANDIYSLESPGSDEWLLKTAEQFCQDKAVYNAIQKAIGIYDGEDKKLTPHMIPDLLSQAIGVSFDSKIGSDYYDDAEARFDYYTNPESKIAFDIDILNKITNGGVTRKTLNIMAGGVNVGKSMSLIALAAGYIRQGYDVLYFSMEMAEEQIMQRLDANMLRTPMNDLASIGKERFLNRVNKLKTKNFGKFKVKEFPPGSATVAHFKNTLKELKLKKGFVPTVVIADYIQIGASAKKSNAESSYYYFKSVAEEWRALAVEENIVFWTAATLNRGGMESSDVTMKDIAESAAIAMTADFMLALVRTDELDELGQIKAQQLKSRYANKSNYNKFLLSVDVERQTLADAEDSSLDRRPTKKSSVSSSSESDDDSPFAPVASSGRFTGFG